MAVCYTIERPSVEDVAEGLKAAGLRLKCADLLMEAIADTDEEAEQVRAVVLEVQSFIGKAAEELAQMDRHDFWPVVAILPSLHARILHHTQSAPGKFRDEPARKLANWFVNAAVDEALRHRPVGMQEAYNRFGRLIDEDDRSFREALKRESAAEPESESADATPVVSATGEEAWPTLPVIPGLFARLKTMCERSACEQAGLTLDKLMNIMASTAIAGFFGNEPEGDERADVGEELKVYKELLARYGQVRQSGPSARRSKPARRSGARRSVAGRRGVRTSKRRACA